MMSRRKEVSLFSFLFCGFLIDGQEGRRGERGAGNDPRRAQCLLPRGTVKATPTER